MTTKTITTREELEALPTGSIVVTGAGDITDPANDTFGSNVLRIYDDDPEGRYLAESSGDDGDYIHQIGPNGLQWPMYVLHVPAESARERIEEDAEAYAAQFMSDPEGVRKESFIAGRTMAAEAGEDIHASSVRFGTIDPDRAMHMVQRPIKTAEGHDAARQRVHTEALDWAVKSRHGDKGMVRREQLAFIAGRTMVGETDEKVREALSEVLLSVADYRPSSDAHPHIVTDLADAMYDAAGLLLEEHRQEDH